MKPKITLYTQPNCMPCRSTKRWLDTRGVLYNTVDLTQSPADRDAVLALGYQQSPVVLVSHGIGQDVHWSGYRPDLLAEHTTLPEQKGA